jgi:hypothetical protein
MALENFKEILVFHIASSFRLDWQSPRRALPPPWAGAPFRLLHHAFLERLRRVALQHANALLQQDSPPSGTR